MSGPAKRALTTAAACAIAAYLATGVALVGPGEAVVVRRLGRLAGPAWREGVHFGLPVGLETRRRLRLDEVRRLQIGGEGPAAIESVEYLTGDRNLVVVRAVAQYRVDDPVAFVLSSARRDELLRGAIEAAVSRTLAHEPIDRVLREDRPRVAASIAASAQAEGRRLGLGVEVLGVSLVEARPPQEVAADFAEAQAARSEKDRRAHEAKAEAARLGAASKAESRSLVVKALAAADDRCAAARGQAERFRALLAEARAERALTLRRLYYNAARSALARVRRKVILQSDEPFDLSVIEGRR